MKKQLRKFLLAAAAVLLGHGGAYAFDAYVDGIYYNLNEDDLTASVTYMVEDAYFNLGAYAGAVEVPASFTHEGRTYSVTGVTGSAFAGCHDLTSLVLPASVTGIGSYAFMDCRALEAVELPASLTTIESSTFYCCTGLKSVTVPSSVTGIEWYAFWGCTGLETLVLPASLQSIGDGAFSGCTGLQSVTCHAQTPPVCENSSVFNEVPLAACVLRVPSDAVEAYASAPVWEEFAKTEALQTGVRGIARDGASVVQGYYSPGWPPHSAASERREHRALP